MRCPQFVETCRFLDLSSDNLECSVNLQTSPKLGTSKILSKNVSKERLTFLNNHEISKGAILMKEKPPLKNIYKKTIAIELIKMGHDLHHTMRNRKDERFQIYVFVETPELIRDMLAIVEWQERLYQEKHRK